jgi:poly(3-hydroxybutyrate) depolymerase
MNVGAQGAGGALVFFWAGTDQPAANYTQIGMNNVERITSQGGMIVSIQGSANHALDTDCSITGYYSHDFVPIGQIAACAVKNYNIDPHRIYSTGCSAGGVTSGCMATRASSYIAAVATNSGGLSMVEALKDSKHAPAVMTMHGGSSDFGGLFTTDSANLDMAIKNAGGFAINCDHGGGHCGASQELQDAAIEFLFAHPFGVDPEPYASSLPMSFPTYCKKL